MIKIMTSLCVYAFDHYQLMILEKPETTQRFFSFKEFDGQFKEILRFV